MVNESKEEGVASTHQDSVIQGLNNHQKLNQETSRKSSAITTSVRPKLHHLQ